jgi:hypothetical protein
VSVHSTVFTDSNNLPSFLTNHGILKSPDMQQLLRESKVSDSPIALLLLSIICITMCNTLIPSTTLFMNNYCHEVAYSVTLVANNYFSFLLEWVFPMRDQRRWKPLHRAACLLTQDFVHHIVAKTLNFSKINRLVGR